MLEALHKPEDIILEQTVESDLEKFGDEYFISCNHMKWELCNKNPNWTVTGERTMKYKTKPCEIGAIQFTRDNWKEIQAFTDGKARNITTERTPDGKIYCYIDTLEGAMQAIEGDYIIKGLRGEFYPCKPDVFEKKYELVESD